MIPLKDDYKIMWFCVVPFIYKEKASLKWDCGTTDNKASQKMILLIVAW